VQTKSNKRIDLFSIVFFYQPKVGVNFIKKYSILLSLVGSFAK
jgi:hypothetical protein